MFVVPLPGTSGLAAAGPVDASPPRLYQVWKGSNVFFLRGRFIFGPDVRSLFLTIFLIVAPVLLFCVFVAKKLMEALSHRWGMSIMVVAVAFTIHDLVLLLLTSGRDPGIIPRNEHPPELDVCHGSNEAGGGQFPLRFPRTKDVAINGVIFRLKYCDTCMLYRPPRASHCSICNNCVERFDHHCPWLGQCIGLRNCRFFYMFVFSTTFLWIYIFGFCFLHIKSIMDAEETTVWGAMTKTPASTGMLIYTFISILLVGGLSVFHLYLMSTNQTTYENLSYKFHSCVNPYIRGVMGNLKEIFFTRIPPSKNKFRVRVVHPHNLPAPAVGEGFISPNKRKTTEGVEMGRKAMWFGRGDMLPFVDLEAGLGDNGLGNEDIEVDEAFPESNKAIPLKALGRSSTFPLQYNRGRRSGCWETSSDFLAFEVRVQECEGANDSNGNALQKESSGNCSDSTGDL